jgi:hypothetical protein
VDKILEFESVEFKELNSIYCEPVVPLEIVSLVLAPLVDESYERFVLEIGTLV